MFPVRISGPFYCIAIISLDAVLNFSRSSRLKTNSVESDSKRSTISHCTHIKDVVSTDICLQSHRQELTSSSSTSVVNDRLVVFVTSVGEVHSNYNYGEVKMLAQTLHRSTPHHCFRHCLRPSPSRSQRNKHQYDRASSHNLKYPRRGSYPNHT